MPALSLASCSLSSFTLSCTAMASSALKSREASASCALRRCCCPCSFSAQLPRSFWRSASPGACSRPASQKSMPLRQRSRCSEALAARQ